jgi:glycosyltransferase involved in cell wall biosynthesis
MIVTVAVATYNSSMYVLETLESIYRQTHTDIDLIVSDDFSTDDTITIVQKWINQPKVKSRFQSIKLLSVANNTGVSANCNRIIKASKTDWIKFIAGDDILYPNCIADNMQFVEDHPEAQIVFSQIKLYQDDFKESSYIKTTPEKFPNNLMKISFSSSDQYELLLLSDRIHYTPSYFFNKQAILSIGGYDEDNKLVEDYPMWLKLTKAGIRLYYFHSTTVGYRIHAHATNNTGSDVLFKPSVINGFKVRQVYAHPHLPRFVVKQETWTYYVTIIFMKLGVNKASPWNTFLYKMGIIYFNPFFWVHAVSKRIRRERK